MEEPVIHYTNEADTFRTRVFGIQDGLIGVGSIALGAAGYSQDPLLVLVTGLIASIGQAFSMGIGEYISTRVRMQIIQNEIKKENYEIEHYPEKEREELKQFYLEKGLPEEEAEEISNRLMKNKNIVLHEMLIHELKLFPDEFEDPVKLGLLMSIYLIIGSVIPLFPFMLSLFIKIPFSYSVITSVILITVTLGFFGSLASKYTGLSRSRGALEQIATGLLAMAGSYTGGLILAHFFPLTSLPL
ncbi:VIT1/CCC1 transporter family protein [Stygiolobus caldivivus]|uniref:Membrane protein n=1 Tax=Stygiolobus caldivivus TaxID=2824673 RepID=A0A8D5ZII1_9CREN|nr:VIT1/CCC1 transporter family protein [Stygiolobus caldivivus]BCU69420.1 membrane protein [Stygiolobus caldivivus]